MNQSNELYANNTAREYYKLAREQIAHEDNLINNRTNWLLAAQWLLFAAFGVVVVDIIKSGNPVPDEIRFLMEVFPPVGILLAVFAFLSVLGAVVAMNGIKADWDTRQGEMSACGVKIMLPPLQCKKCPRLLGLVAPFFIPPLFIVAWLVIQIKVV